MADDEEDEELKRWAFSFSAPQVDILKTVDTPFEVKKVVYESLPSGTMEKVYDNPDFSCSWIPDDVEPTYDNLLKALEVDEVKRRYIWSVDQKEKEWHLARRGRITGSRVGKSLWKARLL